MTALAHTIVAGAIAAKFSDPVAAGALSFVSHFIMDAVPHWDFGTNWRQRSKSLTGILAISETLVAITIAYFLFLGNADFLILTVALVMSLIPDWLETPWYIFFATKSAKEPRVNASFAEQLTYRIYKIENTFHAKTQFPLGALTQVVTVIFFLILLRK